MGYAQRKPWVIDVASTLDEKPSVIMVHPGADRSVLKSAHLELEATASDDIQLSRVGFQVLPVGAEEDSPTPESWLYEVNTTGRTSEYKQSLTIADLNPSPGSIYVVQALASDNHTLNNGLQRKVYSTPTRIQIVDHPRFLTMIRQRLANIRESTRHIDVQQSELERITRLGVWTQEDQVAQGEVTNQIEAQINTLNAVGREMATNRSEDETVNALITFVQGALGRAGHHSRLTSQNMDGTDITPILSNQEEVRFELQGVVEMLGDDESTWIITRELERLLESQNLLLLRTNQISTTNPGLERSNMNPSQLETIASCADDQSAITVGVESLLGALGNQTQVLLAVSDPEAILYEEATKVLDRSDLVGVSSRTSKEIADGKIRTSVSSQKFIINTLHTLYELFTKDNKAEHQGVDPETRGVAGFNSTPCRWTTDRAQCSQHTGYHNHLFIMRQFDDEIENLHPFCGKQSRPF